jgi:hypothetical protein
MSTDFTLRDTDFATEFAKFVSFVGGAQLHEAISRALSKLDRLSPSVRALYQQRYFFHEYCVTISDGPAPFQLDISDANAIRVASFISGVNRMKNCLSSAGASRLRSTTLGALRPDRDLRPLEHEVRVFVHLGQKGITTTLADLERIGTFDMFCTTNEKTFEVECKTVTEDTGEQIKTDLLVTLSEVCRRTLKDAVSLPGSGIFIMKLVKSPALCGDLHSALRNSLNSYSLPLRTGDFELTFEPRPEWGSSTKSDIVQEELQALSGKYSAWKFTDKLLALALLPHKPSSLSEKIVDTLKDAADQCSGQQPSVLWLHLIGHREKEFLELAKFSQGGKGAGLNAVVANVLHPQASTTDRSHVHTIRFSAEPADVTQKPILDTDLLIQRVNSLSGPCYDVPNPFCHFNIEMDF